MIGPAMTALTTLLPIRAVTVRLRFTASSRPGFFHQPALTAWLRNLIPGDWGEEPRVWLDATDSGRATFRSDEDYRLNLFCCAGGEERLQALLDALPKLPDAAPAVTAGLAFSRNLRWLEYRDYFTDAPCLEIGQLFCYDAAALERELAFWKLHAEVLVRFVSPVRLLLPKEQREARQGEARFVRDRGQMRDGLLERRIVDAAHTLLRQSGLEVVRLPPLFKERADTLFWLDGNYYDSSGAAKPMGGALGTVTLTVDPTAAEPVWPYLILGQYLGIGQRRGFGCGRYRLETSTGQGTLPPRRPSRTILARATEMANLELAYAAIQSNRATRSGRVAPEDADEWSNYAEPDTLDAPPEGLDLDYLGQQLTQLRYQAPPLKGVVLTQPGKAPRPLAIPPFRDRVAQRAVAQILSEDFEALMARSSFGYRRGLSRLNARDRIQLLYRQGYRWFFEADIDDFFDSVSHDLLAVRLRSLLPDDPVVGLLMAWMGAPVQFRGERIERPMGLPQGSPLSPLLANLLLDDFDADLEAYGMTLVRFADDFIVVCKSREEAEAAAIRAEASLAELGLTMNPQKSRIGHFDQGLHFLGYTFLRDLAIERPRDRALPSSPLNPATLPPHSWLAQLTGRTPNLLDGLLNEPPPPPSTTPTAPPPAVPAPVSELGTAVFVTGEGVRLAHREGRLHLSDPSGGVRSLAWHGLAAVVLIGRHHLTTPCLQEALRHGVPIHFASGGGRYQGVLTAEEPGAEGHQLWLLQRERFAQPEQALLLSQAVVQARVHNQFEVLRLRARGSPPAIEEALNGLRQCREQIGKAATLAALNGIEGLAARHYYAGLALQIPAEFGFEGRNRQPPQDPFNALLSLGYTILYAHTETVVRAAGLLPWTGFYHQPRGRHAALASDLMEPFRHVVERCALALLNRGQLKVTDFFMDEQQGCRLSRDALRRYLADLGERFSQPLSGRDSGDPQSLHEHLHRQSRQLIDWLRGKGEHFQCFEIR